MSERVLVTGATGTIGSTLVPELCRLGVRTRAFVRDPDRARGLQQAGAELAIGSFEDEGSLASAMRGVDTMVLITPPQERAREYAAEAIEAARDSGVERIVRISVIRADPHGPTDNVQQHGDTDARVQASGLRWTILRPHFFMQNLLMSIPTLRDDGSLYWGMGEGRLGMIDARDIADATTAVATSDAVDGRVYTLTGPASITFHEVARAFGDALEQPISYVPVSLDAVEESLRAFGTSDWFARMMRDYSQAYSENWGDFVTDDLRTLTGHAPRSIDDFAGEVLVPALRAS